MLLTDDSCKWYSELRNNPLLFLKWHVFMGSSTSIQRGKLLTSEMLKKSVLKSLGYCWAPGDAAIICFTSGTTGKPKGVTISHTALIVQSLAKLAIVGYNEDDVYLHIAPLCHIGGISSAMAMLMAGGSHVLIPKFEAKSAIESIEQNCVTSLITVPTIMADLISIIRLKKTWLGRESVKKILNGGGSLPVWLLKDAIKFFPKAKLLSAYGMTEACSSLTFMTLQDPTSGNLERHLQSINAVKSNSMHQHGGVCVGRPAPHVEIKMSSEDSSSTGRILTRGPHVMLHYWGQPQTMASDPGQEDWFDTGDIGEIDSQGNLWLIGRRNGRIKSAGENIYPEEVEAILSQHPGIRAVVVVGLPHDRLGEMVVACVQIRENWKWGDSNIEDCARPMDLSLSSEILKHYSRQRNLTGFKVPKVFMMWKKPFPLTSTGKVKRAQVRKEAILCLQTTTSRL
ncbi:hypothetical protein Ancab_019102 [Ancistrocladus abbreviatus]